ncbi:MAG TPA: phosphoglycerate dehydrogenase [Candidatus Acidoferrales bacterium]|nr:phosphoglycerate dehydrogenase [Candidatus Acidoferrales bacterium]
MRVVVADKISPRGMELLARSGWQVDVPTAGELRSALAEADALVVRSATRVTAELLAAAPRLRVVGRAGAGVDNIDVDACTRRGILVMNTPGTNAVSVAEHTFALMLSLARQVPRLAAAAHAGRWEKGGAMGSELRGKTLGLVGLGRVGFAVARRAHAFEMRVLACDPYVSPEVAREEDVEMVPFDDLLARADCVSLHASLGPGTEKLFNATTLARMKRGAWLINTARGEMIDEAALAAALRSGQLAGAALDVFTVEPPKDSPLTGLANVVATPHVAGSTVEAQEEVGALIAEQVYDYLASGVLRNSVNLPNLSPEQYRRMRPYLELAERLGLFAGQVARGRLARVRIRYAGETAALVYTVLRSAVLAGLLNPVLDEKVNLVNSAAAAAQRGIVVEEQTRRREHGFPDTLEVTVFPADASDTPAVCVEGTVLYDLSPRVMGIDGIHVECDLEGTILFTRNRDVPGVIGQMGQVLGSRGVNIATFALGRREAVAGAEALALVRLDGEVPDSVLEPIRAIPAVVEARLVRLPVKDAQM